MSANCDILAGALDDLRRDITCREAHDNSTLIVTTGRFFSDGDAVELLLRPSDDGARIVVSDGGLTRARQDLSGTAATSTRAEALWNDILLEFGVRELSDRVFFQTKRGAAAAGISIVADACIALDSVHLLTAGERRTFTDKVRAWLTGDAKMDVTGTSVVDKYGATQTVTAVVNSPRGEVIVQAAGGRKIADLRSTMEHAFWVMGGLDDHTYPLSNRLTLLESVPNRPSTQDTLRGLTRRIADVCYVGSFERQIAARDFITAAQVPPFRDLAFESFGQVLAIGDEILSAGAAPKDTEPPF